MRIALAQLNPLVGDVEGNLSRLRKTVEQVLPEKPDLVVFPELFLTGYPPRDLLDQGWFIDRVEKGLQGVIDFSTLHPDIGILVGCPVRTRRDAGNGLYNAAVLVAGGEVVGQQPKTLLPAYDVFDELRYFDTAPEVKPIRFRDTNLGVTVCEDAWNGPGGEGRRRHPTDPVAVLAQAGAELLVNISASPFAAGKEEMRFRLIGEHSRRHGLGFVYLNQVGGNDELVFDGRSLVLDARGEPVAVLAAFEEEVAVVDTDTPGRTDAYELLGRTESVYRALVFGLSDYVRKCGFEKVVIALSGGIDSAVAGCITVEALGAERVLGVTMPSKYSTPESVADSEALARNLGIEFRTVGIAGMVDSYREALRQEFAGRDEDVTEENIQARVRGNILMALSNKFGHLVVSTGNKSELAVGYCTLYGDMSGGLSVLADVPKTMVYELAGYINRERELIPEATIRKPPSAELKPDQKDQDTLPPYEVLDEILVRWIEEGESVDRIVDAGFERTVVEWVVAAVKKNEYKRRQAVPGLRVTGKAFGMGRRFPIAARY